MWNEKDGAVGSGKDWVIFKSLRGHVADVYDLNWSNDSAYLVSGSIDNSVCVWDVAKSRILHQFRNHEKFVQGVCWDPLNEFLCSVSCDKSCIVYSCAQTVSKKRVSLTFSKSAIIRKSCFESGETNFYDDNVPVYFRRLSWSSDGSLLVVPSAFYRKKCNEGESTESSSAALIFKRGAWSRPWRICGGFDSPTTCVSFNPVRFRSSQPETDFKWIYAVSSMTMVVLYDTEHTLPISIVRKIHCSQITDIRWSACGTMLMVSSTDGYCSVIRFEHEELGQMVEPPSTLNQKILTRYNTSSAMKSKTSLNSGVNQNSEGNISAAIQAPESLESHSKPQEVPGKRRIALQSIHD